MAFNVFQLDALSFDDAEIQLEDYIESAIEAFMISPIGVRYLAEHEDSLGWIETFLEIGYLYGKTLPSQMTMAIVRDLMENILPRKISLVDPEEAQDAEAELIAFWTFLKQDYKLPNAGPIITYLKSIKGRFVTWMFDSDRAGIAKSFVTQGLAAGFDMSTQEGVSSFQAVYNQQLQGNQSKVQGNQSKLQGNQPKTPSGFAALAKASSSSLSKSRQPVEVPEPPPEVRQLFDALGISIPDAGTIVDPDDFLETIMAEMERKMKAIGEDPEAIARFEAALGQNIPTRSALDHEEPFPELFAQLLQSQVISETGPGTILRDFERILELLKAQGLPLAKNRNGWALKVMEDLNQGLSKPIDHLFQRPVQKSFPPLQGLFMLVRSLGISQIVRDKKQDYLVLEPEVYGQWQQLNPTERYCTLLEAWLIRAHTSMLGDRARMGNNNEGINCLRSLSGTIAAKKSISFKTYDDQRLMNYYPGLTNVALLEMFGLVTLKTGKPSQGKGWRIQKLEWLPWSPALLELVRRAYEVNDSDWPSNSDPTASLSELQPSLAPYFPEWQQVLTLPDIFLQTGRHIFKVTMRRGDCWRRLAILGTATLAELSRLILKSVGFDNDHLHCFTYGDAIGREQIVGDPRSNDDLTSDLVMIGAMALRPGDRLEYLFDFGDSWYFDLELESIDAPDADPEGAVKGGKIKGGKQSKPAEILETFGKAPKQYSNANW
jgi:hypothetical protein